MSTLTSNETPKKVINMMNTFEDLRLEEEQLFEQKLEDFCEDFIHHTRDLQEKFLSQFFRGKNMCYFPTDTCGDRGDRGQKILVALLTSLYQSYDGESSLISEFLGKIYTQIQNQNDRDDALERFLCLFSSMLPRTTIYFIHKADKTFKAFLSDDQTKLKLLEGEILYSQLNDKIFRYFKVDPFDCSDCMTYCFDPTFKGFHKCVFPVFRCCHCQKSFVPCEPAQLHCGCKGSYHARTDVGQQIKHYFKKQSYLLHLESLKEFRYEIQESIVNSTKKPKLFNLFFDTDEQLKRVHLSIALNTKIERLNDHEFVLLIKQKIQEINQILIHLFEQTFFCYFCQQEGVLSEKQYKFIRCHNCNQIACFLHRCSVSSSCIECDKRLSLSSLESIDIALHKVEKPLKSRKPLNRTHKSKISVAKKLKPLKKI
jgi:hypothetical protein